MESTRAQRINAGLSLLFAPGARPGLEALRTGLDACQTEATIVHSDEAHGVADVIVSGLVFEVDGLLPAAAMEAGSGPDNTAPPADWEAVRMFPGHALSGGLAMAPVSRALLALAAELAGHLTVQAVQWHPARTTIEAAVFSRSVLAWLAGGAFPAPGLVALTQLADGSVVSRGLAHFAGQEVTMRQMSEAHGVKLAAQIVDRMVREGPLDELTQWRVGGTLVNAEPAREAKQVLVWAAE